MDKSRRNDWKAHNGKDTLLNGGLIAAGIVGLLLAVLLGPASEDGLVVTEHAVSADANPGAFHVAENTGVR